MRDSSGVHNGGPNVIDQLLLDKLLAIMNGVEDFTHGERCGGVLTDEAEASLQLCGNGILEPKEMIGLEALSKARRFDRREAMVRVVQQVKISPEFFAQPFE